MPSGESVNMEKMIFDTTGDWHHSMLHRLLLDHVLTYPVNIFCDTCVDPWVSWLTTLVTEGYNANLYPVAFNLQHQWTPRVALKTQIAFTDIYANPVAEVFQLQSAEVQNSRWTIYWFIQLKDLVVTEWNKILCSNQLQNLTVKLKCFGEHVFIINHAHACVRVCVCGVCPHCPVQMELCWYVWCSLYSCHWWQSLTHATISLHFITLF